MRPNLFIVGDPIERLWSSVKFESRNVDLSFDEKLEYLHCRFREASLNPDDLLNRKSRYERTITELEVSVPKEAIQYLFYEDIFYRQELGTLFDFLDLDPITLNFSQKINEGSKSLSKPSSWDWANAIDSFSPTYEALRVKFLDRIPTEWHS